MSRVLTHREISPRRPDCLADEPVNGEPVSGSEFPVIREKNREFRGIASRGPKTGANFEANSECYREIPCATEQGIAFARTGNFEQQNRECIGAIRESSLLTRENLRSAVGRKLSAGIDRQTGSSGLGLPQRTWSSHGRGQPRQSPV